ncbi:MAG TPA: quinol:electron acceptor oxidoreductase subunit ActD [Thermoanaerobaculia bacterium]|nr:quinol:electron acceptor oxidoreductase subunit ActD [Thermoanaerobaculia bacterium]
MKRDRVAVVASFAHPERLAAAWGGLPRVVGDEAAAHAEVRSSTPLSPAVASAVARDRGPGGAIVLCAILGAVVGGTTALGVVLGTEAKWNLSVGGMGGVAGPPTGILTYQGAALGLILATVVGVLLFGGLLRRPPDHGPLDAELAAGRSLLRVEVANEEPSRLEQFFLEQGAVAVATTGGVTSPGAVPDDRGATTEPP